MTSGQMLLAGFNGLFTKVASELTDMFTAFERVHFDKHELKFDIVRDAQELQVKFPLHFVTDIFPVLSFPNLWRAVNPIDIDLYPYNLVNDLSK